MSVESPSPAPQDQLKLHEAAEYEHALLKQGESMTVAYDAEPINPEDFGIPQHEGYGLKLGAVVVLDPGEQQGNQHALAVGSYSEAGKPDDRTPLTFGLVKSKDGKWTLTGETAMTEGATLLFGRKGDDVAEHTQTPDGEYVMSSAVFFGDKLARGWNELISSGHIRIAAGPDGMHISQSGTQASEIMRVTPKQEAVEAVAVERQPEDARPAGAVALKGALGQSVEDGEPSDGSHGLTHKDFETLLAEGFKDTQSEQSPAEVAPVAPEQADGAEASKAEFAAEVAGLVDETGDQLAGLMSMVDRTSGEGRAFIAAAIRKVEYMQDELRVSRNKEATLSQIQTDIRQISVQLEEWGVRWKAGAGKAESGKALGRQSQVKAGNAFEKLMQPVTPEAANADRDYRTYRDVNDSLSYALGTKLPATVESIAETYAYMGKRTDGQVADILRAVNMGILNGNVRSVTNGLQELEEEFRRQRGKLNETEEQESGLRLVMNQLAGAKDMLAQVEARKRQRRAQQ